MNIYKNYSYKSRRCTYSKKSFGIISISLFVNNNHGLKVTHMVRCIQWNIKSSFSHLTLITSIHLNIKTIMWNQVSCPSTESSCTHHAIISQFRYIFKVGQVLSKTQRVYNLQCFFNLPFKLKNIWVKRSEIIFDGTYVIDRNFQMY